MTSEPCDRCGSDVADFHQVTAYVCIECAEQAHHLGVSWACPDRLANTRSLQYLAARLHAESLNAQYALETPTT